MTPCLAFLFVNRGWDKIFFLN